MKQDKRPAGAAVKKRRFFNRISRKLMLFVVLMSMVLLALVWLLSVKLLEPDVYKRQGHGVYAAKLAGRHAYAGAASAHHKTALIRAALNGACLLYTSLPAVASMNSTPWPRPSCRTLTPSSVASGSDSACAS